MRRRLGFLFLTAGLGLLCAPSALAQDPKPPADEEEFYRRADEPVVPAPGEPVALPSALVGEPTGGIVVDFSGFWPKMIDSSFGHPDATGSGVGAGLHGAIHIYLLGKRPHPRPFVGLRAGAYTMDFEKDVSLGNGTWDHFKHEATFLGLRALFGFDLLGNSPAEPYLQVEGGLQQESWESERFNTNGVTQTNLNDLGQQQHTRAVVAIRGGWRQRVGAFLFEVYGGAWYTPQATIFRAAVFAGAGVGIAV